jgi:hypothetical protein
MQENTREKDKRKSPHGNTGITGGDQNNRLDLAVQRALQE